MTIALSKGFADNLDENLSDHVRASVEELSNAARQIAKICARGSLEAGLGSETGGSNQDGDAQKALDVRSDDIIMEALRRASVAYYASEERDDILTFDADKSLAIACDPLDGSSNIDTNISIGTIFSIYPKAKTPASSFLRKTSEQICAGFFVYGPATSLVITTGAGVEIYILDEGVFKLAESELAIPATSNEYAINASNHNHWREPIRKWVEDCLLGQAGPFQQKCNMRWVGSLVADAARILSRGGVFLYPKDNRPTYENGRLRLLYECAPVAFIIEQAGGAATNAHKRILDIEVEHLHQRVAFVFGSKNNVKTIGDYHGG